MFFSWDDPDAAREMKKMLGPGVLDVQVRSVIQQCWASMPDDAKNVEAVAREVRRLVDRAVRDLGEGGTPGGEGEWMQQDAGALGGQIGSLVKACWMLVPDDRKNADAVEGEVRRLVERAIEDLREDAKVYGEGEAP